VINILIFMLFTSFELGVGVKFREIEPINIISNDNTPLLNNSME
jgi:hypothetical protein